METWIHHQEGYGLSSPGDLGKSVSHSKPQNQREPSSIPPETKIRVSVCMEVHWGLWVYQGLPLLAQAPILQFQMLAANSSQEALFWSIAFERMGAASVQRICQSTPTLQSNPQKTSNWHRDSKGQPPWLQGRTSSVVLFVLLCAPRDQAEAILQPRPQLCPVPCPAPSDSPFSSLIAPHQHHK